MVLELKGYASLAEFERRHGKHRAMRCTIDVAQSGDELEAIVLVALKSGEKRTVTVRIDNSSPDKIREAFHGIGDQLAEHYLNA